MMHSMSPSDSPLLEVEDLRIAFDRGGERVEAVRGVSFEVGKGAFVGIVGQSGCGKSVTARAILGLVDKHAETNGSIRYLGRDVLTMSERDLRRLRGKDIAMVFQDPKTSLNPVFSIGRQLELVLEAHGRRPERAHLIRLLQQVEIPAPEARLSQYPHELSGGMRQRVMIAMALANEPALLVADEPTTALDVTIQAQILDLLKRLNRQLGMAVLFISHSLDVVADVAERVLVFHEGRKVEEGSTAAVFTNPTHPQTIALLAADHRGMPSGEITG